MFNGLVALALRQRFLALLAALVIAAWGAIAYQRLPIDAFPDVAPTQVLVSMRAPGLTPEELETRVTVPIEVAMKGIPNLVRMRSTTRFAVTLMTFEFAERTDIYWARAQVNERLQQIRNELPDGVDGGLAPIITPLAEMLMFTLDAPTLGAEEQRALVDWVIRPQLRGVPGVADVNTLGGFVRTYEVVPSPAAMAARGITTQQLRDVLEGNNRNDGAGRVTHARGSAAGARRGADPVARGRARRSSSRPAPAAASCASPMSPRCASARCRATASSPATARARRSGASCSGCAAPMPAAWSMA